MDYTTQASAAADLAALKVLLPAMPRQMGEVGQMVAGVKSLESLLDQRGVIEPDDFQMEVMNGQLALQELQELVKQALDRLENLSALVLEDAEEAADRASASKE